MKRATLLALAVSACLLTGCTNALKDGTGYLEDGNYKEAVTAFQKAVDEGKKTAEAYRGLEWHIMSWRIMNLQKMHLRKQFQQAEERIRPFIISSESAG